MGPDVVAAGVCPEAATAGGAAGATTGLPWRMTPSMLAMGRRRAGAGAVAAAARVDERAVEAVEDLVRAKKAGRCGDSTTDGTALVAGEPYFVRPDQLGLVVHMLQSLGSSPYCMSDSGSRPSYRSETEKRHGAGRGNWGAEGDELKE